MQTDTQGALPAEPVRLKPGTLTRLMWAGWLVFAIALATKLAVWPNKHSVFPVYHAAVQAWLAGDSPYEKVADLDLFRYPPPSLWLFIPFGVLDLRLGGALWGVCSTLLVLAGLLRLRQCALPGALGWSDVRMSLFLLVGLAVSGRGLWNAQANGMLGGLIFLSVAELVRNRPWRSGLAMAWALLLKPTMLSLPMLLAAWRPAWGVRLVAMLAAVVVVTGLLAPRESQHLWQKWVEHGKDSAGERRAAFRDAWTLGLTVADLALPGQDYPLLETPYARWYYPAIPGACAFLALGTGWWLTRWMDPGEAACLLAGLGTCWMLLFGLAIEHPTYLLAAPWLAWAMVSHKEAGRLAWTGLLAGMIGATLGFVAGGLKANPWFPPLSAAMPVAIGLLTVWLVAWGLEQKKA
ncbi:MAG: glycosyltransferase family 87 protein [Planctomycetota bacterium]|nr:glycosyltransferase family 87 protein [Planctomycetota bacterium]